MASQSLVIYYDDEDVDLKALIQELADQQDSRYYMRSMSAIGKMLLQEAVETALAEAKVAERGSYLFSSRPAR